MNSANTISNIIEHVYSAQTYQQIIDNIMRNSCIDAMHIDDVRQEIYINLMDYNGDLVDIYNNNQFKWVFIRICKNQLQSYYSPIYYKYQKKKAYELNEYDCGSYEDDLEKHMDIKTKFNYCINHIESLCSMSKDNKRNLDLFKMYIMGDLSMREISKKTKIPKSSVHKYIQDARDLIETEFDKNIFN